MRLNQSLLILALIQVVLISCLSCQIHRAVNQNDYHLKYEQTFKRVKAKEADPASRSDTNWTATVSHREYSGDELNVEIKSKLTIWISSVLGALLVGLSGILPITILPHLADQHDKLG